MLCRLTIKVGENESRQSTHIVERLRHKKVDPRRMGVRICPLYTQADVRTRRYSQRGR